MDDSDEKLESTPSVVPSSSSSTGIYPQSTPTVKNLDCAQGGSYKKDGNYRKGKKGKDFCYFCEDVVLNFARHVKRNHSNELEVQRILLLPAGNKERRKLLTLLRKEII